MTRNAASRPETPRLVLWWPDVIATNRYDVANSRLISTYRFRRGAQELTSTALHHVYTCAQIGGSLTEAGFGEIAAFADPDGTPFTLGAGRLLVTAVR